MNKSAHTMAKTILAAPDDDGHSVSVWSNRQQNYVFLGLLTDIKTLARAYLDRDGLLEAAKAYFEWKDKHVFAQGDSDIEARLRSAVEEIEHGKP